MNTPPITFTLIATCNGLTCSKVMTEPLTPSGNLLAELEDEMDELAYRLMIAHNAKASTNYHDGPICIGCGKLIET